MNERRGGRFSTRVADPGDAAAIAATVVLAFETYREWAPSSWSPPEPDGDPAERLAEAIATRPDIWFLVAEADGDPVGHVALSLTSMIDPDLPPEGMVNLWQLFVRPQWHGSGIASRLMREAVAEAARRGYTRLRLWTPQGAERARRFYEREGWSATGREQEDSVFGLPIVEYARSAPAG